ncbi:methyltransferase domain-containing protein [Diaminobutyricibacter tongyongensis]|uniref:Methyltransferase domain-containing protein n=1 Tax=Leifsonia tongyongensis TaxID=1268043 RepID=A0A6L9XYQ5_9MICO|nr:methyltransferase domain-containing protein [Diaminobutyricibacter tongyongensis]NEN06118.1 methyltransferase domain-containing protein [Diaminobutyricibacter tongyongensis]
MSAETLAEWLTCPVCREPLAAVSGSILGCTTGHRYDVNKRGYVSLLGPRSRVVGDTASMLDARAQVLDRGTYAPIVDALSRILNTAPGASRIVDTGTGTGYYLRSLLATRPGVRGLAMDLSPAAVSRAVRGSGAVDGLVADTWRPLPIRDGIADLVLNVFAPRNLPEFHRILAPGGLLAVVVPRPEHLQELREGGRMLDVPADKAATLIESADSLFGLAAETAVVFDIAYDTAVADSLVTMGPSAHHVTGPAPSQPAAKSTVTAAVDVLAFRSR